MSFEIPQETYESLHNAALFIAKSMSQKWGEIPKSINPIWQAKVPDFANIYNLTSKEKDGKTGIQIFFENRISIIESQEDEDTKMEMLRRLIIELDTYNNRMDEVIRDYKS